MKTIKEIPIIGGWEEDVTVLFEDLRVCDRVWDWNNIEENDFRNADEDEDVKFKAQDFIMDLLHKQKEESYKQGINNLFQQITKLSGCDIDSGELNTNIDEIHKLKELLLNNP